MEKIVTNLELSKRLDAALKKAGIEVEPLFWWTRIDGADNRYYISNNYHNGKFFGAKCFQYPALTASEIGEMLSLIELTWMLERHTKEYRAGRLEEQLSSGQTLTDTLGEMLCYLLENGLLNNNQPIKNILGMKINLSIGLLYAYLCGAISMSVIPYGLIGNAIYQTVGTLCLIISILIIKQYDK